MLLQIKILAFGRDYEFRYLSPNILRGENFSMFLELANNYFLKDDKLLSHYFSFHEISLDLLVSMC